MAPPASVPGCGQGKCCQHIGLLCEFDLTLRVLFLVAAFNVLITITAYHLPLYQCVAIAFRILVLSVRFIFPQLCSVVLLRALANYLVNHMAYDESTAWFSRIIIIYVYHRDI